MGIDFSSVTTTPVLRERASYLWHMDAADQTQITMSGFSAGCFMAHQMSIIYPDVVKGVVLANCGPYGDKATLSAYTTAEDLKTAS